MTFTPKTAVLFACIVIAAIVSVTAKPPSQLKNGENADPSHFHWVVGIFLDGSSVIRCGGAIISPRHILTAGHCVYGAPNAFNVRSGTVYADSEVALISRVSRYVTHPDFKPLIVGEQNLENDIAILVLEKDLPIDDRRSIIRLPSKQVGSQHGFFAGWGVISLNPEKDPNTLQTAAFKVLEDSECEKLFSARRPQYICALSPQAYTLTGDSGSPLVTQGEVVGLSSSGYRKSGSPDTFTNVYHYVDWVKSVIASNDDQVKN